MQAGLGAQSAQAFVTIKERGIPHHHKFVSKEPPQVQFTYLQAVTANLASPATASGASTPQVHFELKHVDAEAGANHHYFQFHNGVLMGRNVTEGENGNTIQETWTFLSMVGPTASGFLG